MKRLLPLLCLVLTLCGCDQKELCEHHEHYHTLYVDFDWVDAPDANPEGMCILFYPMDGGRPFRFDFAGKHGGQIRIPEGRYELLSYNNDTEAVSFFRPEDYLTHTLYTREGDVLEPIYGNAMSRSMAPRAEGTEEERVVICPDMMWGCHAVDISVTRQGVTYFCRPSQEDPEWAKPTFSKDLIMLYPHPLVRVYDFEVLHVHGLENVSRVSGSLSGMTPALTLSSETMAEEPVTLPFEAHPDGKDRIVGQFLTFGHFDHSAVPDKMAFYFVMKDGSKYVYKDYDYMDVTQQIRDAPDPWHVHLIIDHLDLPEIVKDAAGVEPSVDDWPEENQDIIMDWSNLH